MTRERFALAFAALIAVTGFGALAIELETSLAKSFAEHLGLVEALYIHFRFFTILTNWGIVILMVTTIVQRLRDQPVPSASIYGAALVYIVVVGTTYELLLRRTGMRMNIFFFTDMVMHDIVPCFYLAFWLGFAPKAGLSWRDALRWLLPPLAYSIATQIFGAIGQGYPYFFVDSGRYGYQAVLENSVVFLLMFLSLGIIAVLLSRVVPQGLATREAIDA